MDCCGCTTTDVQPTVCRSLYYAAERGIKFEQAAVEALEAFCVKHGYRQRVEPAPDADNPSLALGNQEGLLYDAT